MNRNYKKGERFEREVMDIFHKEGFQASRTAGSHSEWDVVLVKKTNLNRYEVRVMVLVQCKVKKIRKPPKK